MAKGRIGRGISAESARQLAQIRKGAARGMSMNEIAKEFGISYAKVYDLAVARATALATEPDFSGRAFSMQTAENAHRQCDERRCGAFQLDAKLPQSSGSFAPANWPPRLADANQLHDPAVHVPILHVEVAGLVPVGTVRAAEYAFDPLVLRDLVVHALGGI